MNGELPQLSPRDEYNDSLHQNVRPQDWTNPVPSAPYHLVVIGAGTAGLVTAAGAAGLGARVALIERELMGGDCLNVGCVPSKAMIRAGRTAATVRDAEQFGVSISGSAAAVDFENVMQRMRKLRAEISPNDSAARFAELGVDVYFGQGRFEGGDVISVKSDGGEIRNLVFRKAVIATGARAAAPQIPGLESVDYLTNETLFSLTTRPDRFGIIGGGPIGCEMAQTFARLGSEVVLFEKHDRILWREDPDAAEIVQKQFNADGVQLLLKSSDLSVTAAADNQVRITVQRGDETTRTDVDKLLVAVGRAPNIEQLNLQAVEVNHNRSGILVDEFLRTSNARIYAAGDVCSAFKFTHAADFQARTVIQNALFAVGPFGRKKTSRMVVPWSTYTTPEVAHVGLRPDAAKAAGIEVDTYTQPLDDVDRAILDGQTEGFVRIHTKQGTDQIVGATIVAENAGDMISEISVAMTNGIGLAGIANAIHPYPTQAEAIRKLGDQYSRTKLTPTARKLLRILRWWNVGS